MSLFSDLWRYGPDGRSEPLPAALRQRVLDYVQRPGLLAWRALRDEKVSRGLTLQDAVDAVDIDYPGFCPSGILVARALRHRRWVEARTRADSLGSF